MIKPIKELLRRIHHSIPLKIRTIYMSVLSKGLYFFQIHPNAIFPTIFLFEGLELKSGNPFSFAYAGNLHQMHNYWDHVILRDGFQKRNLGRRFFGNVIPELKKHFPNCGLLIMEQSFMTIPFLNKRPGFQIPFWVRMEIDISRPIDELFDPERRSDIKRRIRKNSLSYEMSIEPKHFEDFYHSMFVPYIKKRYTDNAGIQSYQDFFKTIPGSKMMLIKTGGKIIAGAKVEFIHGRPFLRQLGIVEANEQYMRYGAIDAIYYFLIIELKKHGYRSVDIGGTRPLLKDGLTRYKVTFGAQLCKENTKHSCVRLLVLNGSPGVRSFLLNNPFLFKNRKKEICRALFMENNGGLTAKALNDAVKSSYCDGIKETQVFVFGDNSLPEGLDADGQRIVIRHVQVLVNQN